MSPCVLRVRTYGGGRLTLGAVPVRVFKLRWIGASCAVDWPARPAQLHNSTVQQLGMGRKVDTVLTSVYNDIYGAGAALDVPQLSWCSRTTVLYSTLVTDRNK